MKVTDFINGKVTYDKFGGQYFWITEPTGNRQMLAELRGWGHIQNMFKKKDGTIDEEEAAKFQDEVGDWVADAINEKLEREADNISYAPLLRYKCKNCCNTCLTDTKPDNSTCGRCAKPDWKLLKTQVSYIVGQKDWIHPNGEI